MSVFRANRVLRVQKFLQPPRKPQEQDRPSLSPYTKFPGLEKQHPSNFLWEVTTFLVCSGMWSSTKWKETNRDPLKKESHQHFEKESMALNRKTFIIKLMLQIGKGMISLVKIYVGMYSCAFSTFLFLIWIAFKVRVHAIVNIP